MFCDRCGAELRAEQKFCASCGKPVGVVPMPAAEGPVPSRAEGRVVRHISLLGVLWLAYSVFHLLAAGVLWLVARYLLPGLKAGWPLDRFVPAVLGIIALFLLVKSGLGIAAGWGLLDRQGWARMLTLVVAFIALLHIPFGTALGIYSLWVLLPTPSEEEYRKMARAA